VCLRLLLLLLLVFKDTINKIVVGVRRQRRWQHAPSCLPFLYIFPSHTYRSRTLERFSRVREEAFWIGRSQVVMRSAWHQPNTISEASYGYCRFLRVGILIFLPPFNKKVVALPHWVVMKHTQVNLYESGVGAVSFCPAVVIVTTTSTTSRG
jgi:hypothetical protein